MEKMWRIYGTLMEILCASDGKLWSFDGSFVEL